MTDVKISDMTPKGSNIGSTDLFEVSVPDGMGGYETKSITGAEIASGGALSLIENLYYIADNGNDATGLTTGLFLTLAGMYTAITDASATKQYYVFDVRSGYNIESLTLKPFIFVKSFGAQLVIDVLTMDAAWSTGGDNSAGWDGYQLGFTNGTTFNFDHGIKCEFKNKFYLRNITGLLNELGDTQDVTFAGYTNQGVVSGDATIPEIILENVDLRSSQGTPLYSLRMESIIKVQATDCYVDSFFQSLLNLPGLDNANNVSHFVGNNFISNAVSLNGETSGVWDLFKCELKNGLPVLGGVVIGSVTTSGITVEFDSSTFSTVTATGTSYHVVNTSNPRGMNWDVDGSISYVSSTGADNASNIYNNAGVRSNPYLTLNYAIAQADNVTLLSDLTITENTDLTPGSTIIGNGKIVAMNGFTFGLSAAWNDTAASIARIQNFVFNLDGDGSTLNLSANADNNGNLIEFNDIEFNNPDIQQTIVIDTCPDSQQIVMQFNNCRFPVSQQIIVNIQSGYDITFNGGSLPVFMCDADSYLYLTLKNANVGGSYQFTNSVADRSVITMVNLSNTTNSDGTFTITLHDNIDLYIDAVTLASAGGVISITGTNSRYFLIEESTGIKTTNTPTTPGYLAYLPAAPSGQQGKNLNQDLTAINLAIAAATSASIPPGYIFALEEAWFTATTERVYPGQVLLSNIDGSLFYKVAYAANVDLDITTSGLNGLDTGVVAADTWYYKWAIGDSSGSNPPGFVYSTSYPFAGVTFPEGYDVGRITGFTKTAIGSTDILQYTMQRMGNEVYYEWCDNDNYTDFHLATSTSSSGSNISTLPAKPPYIGALQPTKMLWTKISFVSTVPGDRAYMYPQDVPFPGRDVVAQVATVSSHAYYQLTAPENASNPDEIGFGTSAVGTFQVDIYGIGFSASI